MKKNEMVFYQLVRSFLSEYIITRRNFSDKTAKAYRQSLKLFRNYMHEGKGISFDRMDFSCFSRSHVYDFLVWLKDVKENSTNTLNLRLSAIKSFLKYCSEEDIELTTAYLEVSGIHTFKGEQKPFAEYLTSAQLKHVFSLPDVRSRLGRRNRFFMIFAYETGSRLQELLDLRLDSIIRSDTSVRVKICGKGKKIRYVPVFGVTLKHLDAYLAEFHKMSPVNAFLFYTIHDARQTQMKPGTVDYFLKKYGSIAHKADITFPENLYSHMFRHSVGMAMYKNGIPISYIRDFLGHSRIETTTIYSYADDETIIKALEAVEDKEMIGKTAQIQKKWKGNEQYLIEYCGLD